MIDCTPTEYQLQILQGLQDKKRLAVVAPHGVGKTAVASWIVLWFVATRNAQGVDWKVLTTASSWRQVTYYLWVEIHKWYRKLNSGTLYLTTQELLKQQIKTEYGIAIAMASTNPALIEGAHAEQLLYVFDESKEIPNGIWDSAEGAFSTAGDGGTEAFAFAISTAGKMSGRFYEIINKKIGTEEWETYHIKLTDAIKAGRITQEWSNEKAKLWGKDSAIYQRRVLGRFASDSKDCIINSVWIERAFDNYLEMQIEKSIPIPTRLGVDVARYGDDRSVLCVGTNTGVSEIHIFRGKSTMEICGQIMLLLNKYITISAVIIDVIGIGAGVVDRLRELTDNRSSVTVIPHNASESTPKTDRSGELSFVNKRSALWWSGRELLDTENTDEKPYIVPNEELIGELSSVSYSTTSRGKIVIEKKENIKKTLGKSPDIADAVLLTVWNEHGERTVSWDDIIVG